MAACTVGYCIVLDARGVASLAKLPLYWGGSDFVDDLDFAKVYPLKEEAKAVSRGLASRMNCQLKVVYVEILPFELSCAFSNFVLGDDVVREGYSLVKGKVISVVSVCQEVYLGVSLAPNYVELVFSPARLWFFELPF